MSQQLNSRQLSAVRKLGDVMCPGAQELNLPRFSELAFERTVDVVLDELPLADLKDLKLLLTILSFLPKPILFALVFVLEKLKNMGTPIGAIVRLVRFGLRGIVFSLYYSSPQVHSALGFEVKVVPK